MIAHRSILFLTFVVAFVVTLLSTTFSAHAAKEPLNPDSVQVPDVRPQKKSPGLENDESVVNIVQPPPSSKKTPITPASFQEYFYPYRRAMGVRIGKVFLSTHGLSAPSITGIQFSVTTENKTSYEAGADLMTDGSGSLQFNRRFVFSDGKFRPFAKLGAGILVNPENGMAVWVNFANYRAHTTVGAEYLIRRAESLRVDFETAWSVKDTQVIATAGYIWAW